ncbi:MAG TPA: endonuclease/exonuclease/phosphatase family protein, partial [Salinisphaeraceae bacterium]|nr:endonuclease/exonuclease/phosphatase family protein [Salinisphaeraceae bacterium]
MTPTPGDNILSFLSYNMQVGVGTKRYHEYITRGWRHVLPSRQVHENLGRIAELVAQHDFVGLQELDAGSRRSGHLNQLEWLAQHAGFHYWRAQVNRDLGQLAQHGLGLLARFTPFAVSEHKLPGRIPGRGALIARFGQPQQALAVVVTHLALTPGSRSQQLAAICDLLAADEHAIVMGDTNCSAEQLATDNALAASHLHIHRPDLPTFPSWNPRRGIDHILTTPGIQVVDARALDVRLSDHRPLQMRLALPAELYRTLQDS